MKQDDDQNLTDPPPEWIEEMNGNLLRGLRGNEKAGHNFIDGLELPLRISNKLINKQVSIRQLLTNRRAWLRHFVGFWPGRDIPVLELEIARYGLHLEMTEAEIQQVIDRLDPCN